MAAFAGTRDSFARAQIALRELCGWDLDDDTIRKLTHAVARRATASRGQREDDQRFTQASGATEIAIDAGKANTDTGWRDVKMAVFCKRKAGKAASLEQWDKRELPTPSVRTVVAAIEESDRFTERVRTESDRLGATVALDVTVLADGAEWIWNVGQEVFPQAIGVLDAFHAIEHIADAVKAVWGNDTTETTQRIATGRLALLGEGKSGIEQWIAARFDELPTGLSGNPLITLAAYLAKHPTRLGYAERLAEGRSIGSGLVEGSIKQLVNRRLKQTGAKWKVANVGPLVELAALIDTPEWNALWAAA
jgi:Transposase